MKAFKKAMVFTLAALVLFAFVGCGSGEPIDNGLNETLGDAPAPDSESKVLIVYFSNSGNTHNLTKIIKNVMDEEKEAEETTEETTEVESAEISESKTFIKADVLRLVPAEPYEEDTIRERARNELDDGTRPELTGLPDANVIAQYDTIILGFPIWWFDLPMPVWTFLEAYDFSGKTIIPYFTYDGSATGSGSIDTIKKLCPTATVKGDDYLAVYSESVEESEHTVRRWVVNLRLS